MANYYLEDIAADLVYMHKHGSPAMVREIIESRVLISDYATLWAMLLPHVSQSGEFTCAECAIDIMRESVR